MPLTITQNLPASSCPAVQINAQTPTLAGCFNPAGPGLPGAPALTNGERYDLASIFNQLSGYAWMVANLGGSMPGILWGLDLGEVGALTVQVAAGQAIIGGIIEKAAQNVVFSDNATSYLWLNANGSYDAVVGSTTAPNATSVFLGQVTTSGGVVTGADTSGVQFHRGGLCNRITADNFLPSDTPNSAAVIRTQTSGGVFLWEGQSHKQLIDNAKQVPQSVVKQTISGTFTIPVNAPNNYWFTVSAGTPTVLMPNPADVPLGWTCVISNIDGSASFHVKDYTNTTTIATLTAGEACPIGLTPGSGSPAFPASVTPVPVGPLV